MAKEWFIMLMPDTDMMPVCSLDPDRDSMLDWMYSRIQCSSIECVPIESNTKDALIMIVDEEGLYKEEAQLNASASSLYIRSGGRGVIVGRALIGRRVLRYGEPDIGGFETSDDAKHMSDRLRRYM